MLGFECVRRGIRSINNDSARDVVIMCGRVTSGSEIVGIEGEVTSSSSSQPGFVHLLAVLFTFFSRFVASISTSVSGRKL